MQVSFIWWTENQRLTKHLINQTLEKSLQKSKYSSKRHMQWNDTPYTILNNEQQKKIRWKLLALNILIFILSKGLFHDMYIGKNIAHVFEALKLFNFSPDRLFSEG